MNPKNATNNLAIIGASGTGKTTLAVGLYATSTKAFTVSPIGDETRKYLEIRQTSIQEGFWPAATNESENFDLRLGLHAAGRRTDIVFREYMGERMERDPNYIREVIGKPKSAMILFNPGMPGLEKPEARNRMIGNLKKIAQHLKDNRCIAVAFVVTASDRLSSDLKDFREDFEAYASEVTNHLTNLRLNWRRFDVTVSGQLEDQNKPKLARGENNTTHEPFLWLLACIKHHEFWRRVKVSTATAAALLVVAGAAFGGFVWSSRSKLASAEASLGKCLGALKASYASYDEAAIRTNAKFLETNAFERLSAILPADRARKDKVVAHAKEQKDLWGVRLLATEFALTTKRLKEKPADVQLGWFRDFDGKLTSLSPSFTNAVSERAELADAWKKSRVAMETRCQTSHYRDEVERETRNLDSARPENLDAPIKDSLALLADKNGAYALVTNRSDLCIGLLKARTNAIARYVGYKTNWKPTDDNPPDGVDSFIQRISKDLKSGLTAEEFKSLPSVITKCHDDARNAWEKYQFPLRKKTHLDTLKAASDSPASALKDSLAFINGLDALFPSIQNDARASARTSVESERVAALQRYAASQTRWKPSDSTPPSGLHDLVERSRTYLSTAVTDDEFAKLEGIFEEKYSASRKDWEAFQFPLRKKSLLDDLKATSDSPADALRASLAFLTDSDGLFPSISETDRVSARAAITNERALAIGRYIDSKTRWKPEDDGPPGSVKDLHLQARTDLKGALTTHEFDSLESKLAQRRDYARRAWDAYHFPLRARELETALNGAGTNPARPLKESLAFLGTMTNDYPTISQADFIRTRTSLTQARNGALAAYGKSIADKWNVNGQKPPEFDGQKLRETVLTDAVVTDKEAVAFDLDMQKRFQSAKTEWDKKQKSLVDDFSVGGDPETMVSKYGEFCDEWPNNPHLADLSAKVDRTLQAYFRAFIDEYESTFLGGNGKERVYYDQYPNTRMAKVQQSFNKFVAVCRKLNGRGLEGNRILKEPSGRFANLCNDNGLIGDVNRGIYSMFPQSLRITKIEAKFEVESSSEKYRGLDLGIGFSVMRWDFENNQWNPTFDRLAIPMLGYDASKSGRIPKASSGWVTLPCDPITADFNPYHISLIYFKVEDRLAGFTGDVPADDIAPLDFDDNNECKLEYTLDLPHDFHPNTRGKFYLRVTGKRTGAGFEDCARKTGIIR